MVRSFNCRLNPFSHGPHNTTQRMYKRQNSGLNHYWFKKENLYFTFPTMHLFLKRIKSKLMQLVFYLYHQLSGFDGEHNEKGVRLMLAIRRKTRPACCPWCAGHTFILLRLAFLYMFTKFSFSCQFLHLILNLMDFPQNKMDLASEYGKKKLELEDYTKLFYSSKCENITVLKCLKYFK